MAQSSPFSWRWDSHGRPPHSQRLHFTLAELDEKIKTMLDLIEVSGDTFAERAEMYNQKRPQLIKMVQQLHISYRALANNHDHLKSASSIKASNLESVSDSSRKMQPLQDSAEGINTPIDAPNFNFEELSAKSGMSSWEFRSPESFISCDRASHESENVGESEWCRKVRREDVLMMRENVWDGHMKFWKLLEENLLKQAELIRRNDEKREEINELRKEILSLKSSGGCSSHKCRMKGKEQRRKRKLRGFFCFAC